MEFNNPLHLLRRTTKCDVTKFPAPPCLLGWGSLLPLPGGILSVWIIRKGFQTVKVRTQAGDCDFWENASWECFLKILIIVHHYRFVIIASSGEMIAETDWSGRTGGCTGRGTGPAPTGGSCLTWARSWRPAGGRPWWPGTSPGAGDRDRGRGESSTRRTPTTTASAPGSPPSPSPTRRRRQTTTVSPGRRGHLMKKLNVVCVHFFQTKVPGERNGWPRPPWRRSRPRMVAHSPVQQRLGSERLK